MTSDATPQPYGTPPYQPQPSPMPPGAYQPVPPPGSHQPVPPGAYQPARQPIPYVEPGAPGGGQPPYLPPGAYVPVPPPAPRRRGANVAVAAIISVVLLAAVGAFVLFEFVLKSGPDPAGSFPASASMYMEVNLDPSYDQTPKLLEHLSKFGDLDYDTTDDLLADLVEEYGLEGVDAEEDLSSWLGSRHGIAAWQYEDETYAIVSLASTDAGEAEDGLARVRAAAGVEEDQMAYTVEDDHVLMVLGETGAAAALDAAQSEALDDPLAASADYDEARSWLDGDQLIVYWVDMDAAAELAGLTGEEADLYAELYSGQLVAGFSAFDDGFELTYRLFGGTDDPWTGSGDLLADMGELPAADFVATAGVPEDIDELTEEWTSTYEELYGSEAAGEPLTDEEYAEYLELDEDYWAGTLTAEEEERYFELDERYWNAGTVDEPWTDDYSSDDDMAEIEAALTELTDLLAGADLSIAGDFDAQESVDPESLLLSAHLADDRAADLQALLDDWLAADGGLPEGVEVDGSEITYTGSETAEGTLAEDARFSDFAEAAPDQAAVAVWVDLVAAAETYPDDFEGAEALSAFAWAHGSDGGDGTGVLRLYLKD